ncbi:MAG TPA: flagellar biosynthetic protein FliO [Terracidiphilus sp.]|jgi:hypothetical protein|nr:flagellar biosynthetic protein FliO [Terracidiphilus sp.]
MSSPLRIFYSEPASVRPEESEPPATSSFAKTLRRFAEKQTPGPVNTPQLSVVPEPKAKRPRVVGTPLTMGGVAATPEPLKEEPVAQPAEVVEEPKKQLQPLGGGLVSKAWSWLQKSKFSSTKQLRVAETISLGEKRFVALVDIEGQKFLIGGGASGVSLLTQLGAQDSAKEAMQAVEAAAGQSK